MTYPVQKTIDKICHYLITLVFDIFLITWFWIIISSVMAQRVKDHLRSHLVCATEHEERRLSLLQLILQHGRCVEGRVRRRHCLHHLSITYVNHSLINNANWFSRLSLLQLILQHGRCVEGLVRRRYGRHHLSITHINHSLIINTN